MRNKLLIDNWTLQNAGELLHRQHRGELTHELDIAASAASVVYESLPQDVVGLSCLCQLIQNVVLSDELVVDAAFTSSWTDLSGLALLTRHGLIAPRAFKEHEDTWRARREALADELGNCSGAIRRQHEQNKRDYAETGASGDPMLAQVIWGTAGMIARSHVSRLPYVSHPLRERLLQRSQILQPAGGAQAMLTRFIETEQLKLFERTDLEGIYCRLRLPPVMVRVINEAASAAELLPAAIELRNEYTELRHWLAELQAALDAEDIREISARRKPLQAVSEHLARLGGEKGIGAVNTEIGIVNGLPSVSLKASIRSLANSLLIRFGVRAAISRLVLAPPGRRAFERLLRLLGETDEGAAHLERAFHAFQTRP